MEIRKCPYCKSTKGVTIRYTIGGNGCFSIDFKGNTVLEAENDRSTYDKLDYSGECLSCGKSIEVEKIKTS